MKFLTPIGRTEELSIRLKKSRISFKSASWVSSISGFLSHQEASLIIGMPAVEAARDASMVSGKENDDLSTTALRQERVKQGTAPVRCANHVAKV